MAKKKDGKKITPFRVSVGLNIVLGGVLLAILASAAFAYHQYTTKSERALNFALAHNSVEYYCDAADKDFEKWLLAEEKTSGLLSAEDKKRIKLQIDLLCYNEAAAPYLDDAAKKYFEANGLKL